VLALAGLPQMMNRADMHHVVYGLAPGIGLLAIGVESGLVHIRPVWARVAVTLPCLLLLAGGALGLRWKFGRGWTSYPTARVGTVVAETAALAEARVQVLAFIARYSAPDERIFVGCEQHERVFISEMDLYFLSDRRGAVRRMQFDPNLTNREDEQRLMIAQIESMGTRVVVLAPFLDPHEPNDSAKSGSGAFDRYLDQHFELRERAGPYRLLLRRP